MSADYGPASVPPVVRRTVRRRILAAFIACVVVLGIVYVTGALAWLAVLAPGAALAWIGGRRLRRIREVPRWPRLDATIVGARLGTDVHTTQGGWSPYYYPLVEFEYEVAGARYRREAFGPMATYPRAWTEEEAWKQLEGFDVGGQVTVWVSPANPAEAYVTDQVPPAARSEAWAFFLGGMLVILASFGSAWLLAQT